MNELREEIELPPMDYGLAAHEQCDVRERQLKSSLAANREQKAEIERMKDSLIQAKRRTFTSWGRAHIPGRLDFIGVRTLENGQREFLTHNEGLCDPYYLTLEGGKPVAPTLPGEEK